MSVTLIDNVANPFISQPLNDLFTIPPGYNRTTIPQLCSMSETDTTENLYLVVMIGAVKHGFANDSINFKKTSGGSGYRSSYGGPSKFNKSSSTYHRMFIFFDIDSARKCGCLFELTLKDEQTLWRHTVDCGSMAVGDCLLIIEPVVISQVVAG